MGTRSVCTLANKFSSYASSYEKFRRLNLSICSFPALRNFILENKFHSMAATHLPIASLVKISLNHTFYRPL
jgi:glutathione peroxidase-family protein